MAGRSRATAGPATAPLSGSSHQSHLAPPDEAELVLIQKLRDAPRTHNYRYTEQAQSALLEDLFLSLAGNRPEYLHYFFPDGPPDSGAPANAWNLSKSQGAVEGAEYSAAARGKPCGHIFKCGEATYRCK